MKEGGCILACTYSVPKLLSIGEVGNELQWIEIADHQSTGRNVKDTLGEMVCKESKLGKQYCRKFFVGTNEREKS